MKKTDILPNIEKAIAKRENPGPHFYYLYIVDATIKCSPMYSTPPPAMKIGQFPNASLEAGFTSRQWAKLENVTAALLAQKGWVS